MTPATLKGVKYRSVSDKLLSQGAHVPVELMRRMGRNAGSAYGWIVHPRDPFRSSEYGKWGGTWTHVEYYICTKHKLNQSKLEWLRRNGWDESPKTQARSVDRRKLLLL